MAIYLKNFNNTNSSIQIRLVMKNLLCNDVHSAVIKCLNGNKIIAAVAIASSLEGGDEKSHRDRNKELEFILNWCYARGDTNGALLAATIIGCQLGPNQDQNRNRNRNQPLPFLHQKIFLKNALQ